MKSDANDPWRDVDQQLIKICNFKNCFEDSFVVNESNEEKLLDSEEYLQKLYSRLATLHGSTSKKDLVNSLSAVKEDCLVRLIAGGSNIQPEEETELAPNLLLRHITPHLQALTASELIHLLKADVLEITTSEAREDTNDNSVISN